jgi:hypothetical protein
MKQNNIGVWKIKRLAKLCAGMTVSDFSKFTTLSSLKMIPGRIATKLYLQNSG